MYTALQILVHHQITATHQRQGCSAGGDSSDGDLILHEQESEASNLHPAKRTW